MSKKEKELIKVLEQEKNLLKITLDHYVNENSELKRYIEDMKITVKANKDQLNEYVTTITSKDKVVEKMKNTISQLQNRLEYLEIENNRKNYNMKNNDNKYNNQPIFNNIDNLTQRNNYNNNNINKYLNNKYDLLNIVDKNIASDNKEVNTKPITSDCKQNKKDSINNDNNDTISNSIDQEKVKLIYKKALKHYKNLYEKLINQKQKLQEQFNSINKDVEDVNLKLSELKTKEINNDIQNITSKNNKTIINFKSLADNSLKFSEFVDSTNKDTNVILLIDDLNRIWEVIKRNDINLSTITKGLDIYSLKTCFNDFLESNDFASNNDENIIDCDISNTILNNDDIEFNKNSDIDLNDLYENKSLSSLDDI